LFAARNEECANCAGVLLTFSLEQYVPSERRPIDRWHNNKHKKHNSFHSHVVWRAKRRRGRRADAAAAAARNAKRQILVAVVATTGLIVVKEGRKASCLDVTRAGVARRPYGESSVGSFVRIDERERGWVER
jgi:hypothetical protein